MYNEGDDFSDETLAQFGALKKRAEFFMQKDDGEYIRGIKLAIDLAVMEGEAICFPRKVSPNRTVITMPSNVDLN